LNRLCQTKELAATLAKVVRTNIKKSKASAQATLREQAKATQAEQAFALPKTRKRHQ
jgi:hypothetical protein